jgi:hypothetical protein
LAVILQDFVHGAAVVNSVEQHAPEEGFVFGDGPAAASGFADKGMEVTLLFGTFL